MGGRKDRAITNYLDDFLFLALLQLVCNAMINQFLQLCRELNIPVALEKTEWADTLIIFLGILIDRLNHSLSIPLEKQIKALNLLNDMCDRRKTTVKQLQVLTGYLNFLTKAIFAGRTFIRCMYAKYSGCAHLKPYHHMHLDSEFKFDCEMWRIFLTHYRNQAVCRPMVDLKKT